MAGEWEAFGTAKAGPEILYEGMPVGSFEDGVAPTERGTYRYMSYRSYGSYAMGQILQAGGTPACTYESLAGTVRFEVIARHRDARLELDNFTLP